MEFCIVNADGIIENMIVADESFASEIGALPGYEGTAIGAAYAPPAVLTPAQQRKAAYEREALVEWEGQLLTVTEAAQVWQYYAAEGNIKSYDIQRLIAEAKAAIRKTYPDGEVSN